MIENETDSIEKETATIRPAAGETMEDCPECGGVVSRVELQRDGAPGEGAAQPCGHPVIVVRNGIGGARIELLPFEDAPATAGAGDDDLGTYRDMLDQYLSDQRHWIGPAQTPLVFHLRKIGQQLDRLGGAAPASLSSAYLQAFRRLDLQRPGNKEPAGTGGDLPGQGSIFDELGD